MQLDRTSIVIAQRSNNELLDLSLAVVRTYWRKLVLLAIAGALPFALLNFIFLYPITDYAQLDMASREFSSYEWYRIRYLWTMLCLVFLQAPMAMMGVCYFLGQVVFIEEPSLRQVVGVIGRRLLSIALVLGFYRGALLSILFAAWLFANPVMSFDGQVITFSTFAFLFFFLVRCFRPFAPEILLLERCPLFKKSRSSTDELSYSKRSGWIHSNSGDFLGTQISFSFVAAFSILLMCGGSLFLTGVLVGVWQWGWWMDLIFFPLVLWMIAIWDTVIRFLLYLNTRIRLEGWEIQLRLNAESQRLQEARI
jgi:hypothetical protein